MTFLVTSDVITRDDLDAVLLGAMNGANFLSDGRCPTDGEALAGWVLSGLEAAAELFVRR